MFYSNIYLYRNNIIIEIIFRLRIEYDFVFFFLIYIYIYISNYNILNMLKYMFNTKIIAQNYKLTR